MVIFHNTFFLSTLITIVLIFSVRINIPVHGIIEFVPIIGFLGGTIVALLFMYFDFYDYLIRIAHAIIVILITISNLRDLKE